MALLLLLTFYFALASRRVVQTLRRFYDSRLRGGLLIAMLIIPYLLVSLPAARNQPAAFASDLARMLAYLFVPGLLLLFRPRRSLSLDGFDLLSILGFWFPIEFDWLPNVEAALAPGVSLPIPMLTGICLGLLLFLVIRPLKGVGYTFRLTLVNVGVALTGLVAFMVVGIPLGVAMGFIQFGLVPFEAGKWLTGLLAIYFFTALSEELLFRGIIQNLVEQRIGRNWGTLFVAAVIFGLAHINNTTAFHAPPNWPYVIMATLGGLAYGWAWRKSGKITASAITHTLVNFIWGVVFGS